MAVTDLGPTKQKNNDKPIRAYLLEVGKPTLPRPMPKWRLISSPLAAALAALLLLAVASGWYILNGRAPNPAQAAHLSIVVLPFANLSGDPAQDYFADGITENLTTELSRIKDSFVIARNTAFTFKGKSIDAKEIGKELGVRYVLEGSVQRDQNRVRVNAQLIDAESGAHLWADRFEEDIADLFKLQDQVVARLAGSLGYVLTNAEAEKGARSNNPDVLDLTMQGWTLIWRAAQQTPTERRQRLKETRALFEQALKIDPNDPDALAGSAYTYYIDFLYGWSDAPLRPRATAELTTGRCDQAKADMERAMSLSPRDPYLGVFLNVRGDAQLCLGHSDAAIDELRQAIDSGYRPFFAYADLSAAYAQANRMDEAKAAAAEARRLNPKLTVNWYLVHYTPFQALVDGLRKAGLPEE
jgi:TolB-like protein